MRRCASMLPIVIAALILGIQSGTIAQTRPSIDTYISPAYPYELVSARKADRIA